MKSSSKRFRTNTTQSLEVGELSSLLSLFAIIFSSSISIGYVQPSAAQTSPSCNALPIKSVSANGYDPPKSPAYAFDSSLNTRWTNAGLPSWIKADLTLQRVICFVQIAWYRGDLRQNDFTISVSNDGVSFTNVFKGKSSGTSLLPELYQFTKVLARYVKITVNGNTENNVASITEIDIVGYYTPTVDNFEGGTYSLSDGKVSPNQKWKCRFTGFGTVKVVEGKTGNNWMYLAPKASTSPGETHAAAVDTTSKYKDFDLTLNVRTNDQLRQNSRPNNWETAWVNWNSIDQFHAYGFTLKISGNQLEKKDNNIQDDSAEIFLVTQSSPSVKLDTWQKWRIKVTGTGSGTPHIEIWVDGAKITDYIDNKSWIPKNSEKMKQGGTITLYTEDAAVGFDNVNITPL
jgi:hypothetical protein